MVSGVLAVCVWVCLGDVMDLFEQVLECSSEDGRFSCSRLCPLKC
jgi:hypothetical protein